MNILETIIKDLKKDNGEKYKPNCGVLIFPKKMEKQDIDLYNEITAKFKVKQ